MFPRDDGGVWTEDDWRKWSRVTYRDAAELAGLPRTTRPYDLRHARASMLIQGGENIVSVAQQMGHSASTCLGAYAHVMEIWAGHAPVDIEEQIAKARMAQAVA